MRTVVVGASSGLGRAIGVALGQRGGQVALLARRKDRLDDAVAEAGSGAVAVACDVTDQPSVKAAIDEAATAMGGIDSVVYATGVGVLKRLVDLDTATWHHVFDTNVIGASHVTAAAIPYLTENKGVVAFLSSITGSVTEPWPGLGSYAVSKAALDKLIEAYRVEYPTVGFTRVTVGNCVGGEGGSGTEFPFSWDPELAAAVHPIWFQRDYVNSDFVQIEDLINVVHAVITSGAALKYVVVDARRSVPLPLGVPTQNTPA
ncbi:SDR family oxidoreductase [Frankia sp. CNm7]|uniref:SDR family oxidoreductase n=1 Tax=Frankia nepalensis TaxID=1836974 RepID=A0A937UTU7_9ACTN|nr:SDR family oxidoreductase [Frankia nepalensis]MBL7500190.1 SDR family oxidoreductase [Frankia nepalensis]MBL7509430.1 SDR family oxidoreductase [Frankia nepalensis]MBL7524812.1 SDR family oxidoreductase [Frankia nepalensis]MBL7631620.1 SDR family oxidoreductase [Frankia nepalensis]